jgi:hypothetical protein
MATTKTKLSDYLEYRQEYDALEDRAVKGLLPQDKFLAESDALLERFRGKVFPEDVHYFDDFKSYASFVLSETGAADGAVELLRHERQHAMEAEKKGMKFRYGCAVLIDDVNGKCADDCTIDTFVMLLNPDTKDAKDILDACDDPSERDKDLRSRL